MSATNASKSILDLRRAVRDARSDAWLVEARLIRRIIREQHGFARLSAAIPHTDVLVVRAADLRHYAHPDELQLEDFSELPDHCILVCEPDDADLENGTPEQVTEATWARLFHGAIDLALLLHQRNGSITRAIAQDCIDRVGQVEFDEAHAVLRSEDRLFDPTSHLECWCEFAAVFLQITRFKPDLLSVYFPSLSQSDHVLQIVSQFLDPDELFNDTRLGDAGDPDLTPAVMQDEARLSIDRQSWAEGSVGQPSPRRYARMLRKRSRWYDRGNSVAAAIYAMLAAECASTDEGRQQAFEYARSDINELVDRLQDALNFDDNALTDWQESLWELLENSTQGFWNSDKRLLYDLQKVCLDHERTVFKVDLVKWIVSRGKRPLRRPLKSLREVMMAKHLASSAARLVYVRLSGRGRQRLTRLLHSAADLAETQMRERMRPAVEDTIQRVGLAPASVPEQVALDKMVDEALDCIAERGYLTMGYLRDAISRNDLKLPDLSDAGELVRGDHLLRADDQLDVSLDGVYRPGEFYLRWLQVVSSLFFGTGKGRFATLFLFIPFGGAVVIVVGVHHLVGVLTGESHKEAEKKKAAKAAKDKAEANQSDAVADSDDSTESSDSAENEATAAVDAAATEGEGTAGAAEPEQSDAIVAASKVQSSKAVSLDKTSDASEMAVESVLIEGQHESHWLYKWMGDQTVPLSVTIGFLVMALVHLPKFRGVFWNVVRLAWDVVKAVFYDVPVYVFRLPLIRELWRSRWFTRVRRTVLNPLFVSWIATQGVPHVYNFIYRYNTSAAKLEPQPGWMVLLLGVLMSAAINSRLGRDAEELAGEWMANRWHELRTRFLAAVFEWVMDFFKWLLHLLERFIYAVDEWLRFHSGETWLTVVVKAILGVVWSFASFLIRIYVNLLIEPTLHPVKHFPVVTVAHKLLLPAIIVIESWMRNGLTPYLGEAFAGPITWFNIVFLPGIFGFLVWELKENWRLYATNRVQWLTPVIIGSHGERGGRLVKPGFHSGTLPKLFGRLRRLENKPPSFHRFSERRAFREALEHTERDIQRFVERDLLKLLTYCVSWQETPVYCRGVHAASNSFLVELSCPKLGDRAMEILFQEQSGWLVATVASQSWLKYANPDQFHSFETALRGFYHKAGVELVREQMERQLVGPHPYDIASEGLTIWPERRFDDEIVCDLHRRHQIRPVPAARAADYSLPPVSRELVVFSESKLPWAEWQELWQQPVIDAERSESGAPASTDSLPLACYQSARNNLLRHGPASDTTN